MNMKRIGLFFCTLAILAVDACQRTELPMDSVTDYTIVFTANTESDDLTKASVGKNASGRVQTFWEDGDMLSVYSSGNIVSGSTSTKMFYGFKTVLTSPASSAAFGYDGTDFVPGDKYVAIYPHTANSPRSVNFGAKVISSGDDRMAYHMSQVKVPEVQTLVAGSFDRTAAVAIAFSDDLSVMNFKNAVALIKFKVADESITRGCIKAEGTMISGTFKACVLESEGHEPVLVNYSSGTAYAQVEFSLKGNSALSPEDDYYVAVRPTALQNGFSIYLNGEIVKRYDIAEIKRNVIYDLGTLSVSQTQDDAMMKTMSFDFSSDENLGDEWPREDGWQKSQGNKECLYDLNGVKYSFLCTDCTDATSAKTYWSDGCLYLKSHYRYLGLPVIDGYRLVKVSCLHATSAKSSGRGLAVTSDITKSTVLPTYVKGGEPQITTATGDWLTFELEGTSAGTRYYLNCSKLGIGLSNITLVYEKDEMHNSTPVRVGIYNLRVSGASETDSQNNWENRKYRVVQSIKDCNFDVFGVNECSRNIKAYIEMELASMYSGCYFNPYSKTGIDDSSKVEYVGILYKSSIFTLSDWHYFWQAADLASSYSKPSSHNDVVDESTKYYRGGCCCILTHRGSGKKMFVISVHGCLDELSRNRYAATIAEIEKKYNPDGYPAFFVGDMNARPSSETSAIYRQYWSDAYLELYSNRVNGPFATFNGFSLDRDLMADPRRIDYVYFRGSEPFNYVCSDRKYDGYYASDHLPVYIDTSLK